MIVLSWYWASLGVLNLSIQIMWEYILIPYQGAVIERNANKSQVLENLRSTVKKRTKKQLKKLMVGNKLLERDDALKICLNEVFSRLFSFPHEHRLTHPRTQY